MQSTAHARAAAPTSPTAASTRTSERGVAVEDTFCEDPPITDYHDHRSIIGRGVYGITYRMINITDGHRFAVKRFHPGHAAEGMHDLGKAYASPHLSLLPQFLFQEQHVL